MTDRLHVLLRYAVLAPSRHNSQPWQFEIEGDELRVYIDPRRALREADPQGRARAMACGAAVHNVEVAARHFGIASSVEILGGSRRDGLVARLTLEEARPARHEDHQLFDAIIRRRTYRFAFDDRPVPAGAVARMIRAATWLGVRVRAVDAPLRPAVAELVTEADHEQWSNPRFRAELAAWSRSNDPGAIDGLPGHAQGLSDAASMLHRVLVRVGRRAGSEALRDRQQVLHSPALLSVSTDGDRGADWLAAGRALQAALLRAAAEGLSASFFSQAIEVPTARQKLRDAIGERGWPQLLLRVGHGREVRATPRRPVEDVLRAIALEPIDHAVAHAIVRAGDHERADEAGFRT